MMESSTTTVLSAPGKVLLAGGYLVLDPHYSGVVVSTSSRFYTVVSSSLASSSSDSNGTTIKTNITTQDSRSRGRARNDPIRIRVRSPQFVDATWLYVVSIQETTIRIEQIPDEFVFPFLPFHSPTIVSLTSLTLFFTLYIFIYICMFRSGPQTLSKNKFVQLAVERTLSLALEIKGWESLQNTLTDIEITILGDNDFYSQRAQVNNGSIPPLFLFSSFFFFYTGEINPILTALA